jgi:hypothetical protein
MENDLIPLIVAKLKAATPETQRDVLRFVEQLETQAALNEARFTDTFEPFFGLTQGARAFEGDHVSLQRRLRDAEER